MPLKTLFLILPIAAYTIIFQVLPKYFTQQQSSHELNLKLSSASLARFGQGG